MKKDVQCLKDESSSNDERPEKDDNTDMDTDVGRFRDDD